MNSRTSPKPNFTTAVFDIRNTLFSYRSFRPHLKHMVLGFAGTMTPGGDPEELLRAKESIEVCPSPAPSRPVEQPEVLTLGYAGSLE